jgi:hypothetical protein
LSEPEQNKKDNFQIKFQRRDGSEKWKRPDISQNNPVASFPAFGHTAQLITAPRVALRMRV